MFPTPRTKTEGGPAPPQCQGLDFQLDFRLSPGDFAIETLSVSAANRTAQIGRDAALLTQDIYAENQKIGSHEASFACVQQNGTFGWKLGQEQLQYRYFKHEDSRSADPRVRQFPRDYTCQLAYDTFYNRASGGCGGTWYDSTKKLGRTWNHRFLGRPEIDEDSGIEYFKEEYSTTDLFAQVRSTAFLARRGQKTLTYNAGSDFRVVPTGGRGCAVTFASKDYASFRGNPGGSGISTSMNLTVAYGRIPSSGFEYTRSEGNQTTTFHRQTFAAPKGSLLNWADSFGDGYHGAKSPCGTRQCALCSECRRVKPKTIAPGFGGRAGLRLSWAGRLERGGLPGYLDLSMEGCRSSNE